MATPLSVVIPKAAFAACLLRPDPTSVPHDEISDFHTCLERALSHCSPVNIQTCKAWLLRFVAFSSNRVKGLVNYLEALAASLHPQPTGSKVSPKRQRLHILYLLNDLLHHCKYHLGTSSTFSTVSGSLQLHLVNLVGYAATCDRQKNPRHHRRLDDLLDIWSEHEYFHPELVNKLREVVTMGAPPPSNDAANDLNPAKKSGKDAPFIVPSTHGDPSTPWHEVRAGNIYPHIIPNSTIPIQPDSLKPIKLLAGPADQKTVDALKAFLADVNKLYDPETLWDDKHDIDELGQTVMRGENTSDILDGQHYYGWSLEFCQPADTDTEDSRDRSRSRSPSGSRTYRKRRYSDSSSSQSEPESPRQGFRQRRDARSRSRSPRRSPRPLRSRESSYTPRETSHFPPPHQPQHPSAPISSFPPAHPPTGQYVHHTMGPNTGYPQAPAPNYGSWPPPPPHSHMPTMPFPPPGPASSSAFPPPYHHPPSMPQGQNQGQGYGVPAGQYHFPPPYSGGQQGGPWGPPPPPPPQGGRGWQ
ncbi:RNA polymerase II large subunit CTD [Penicillium concentricum]|uniref:RNA polymerase II large subunit CTD n=1 Tax=Penicillium concentricum TaxID=293559 RepID=A0A9W9V459_9EURO|nr:RNA polymerase II large subunit CTD [Penicillium concentricum]KAJ5365845.1 RNA polymerase II large subunit CTD [Penicillium concentricum]